jgi:hypothetical protein
VVRKGELALERTRRDAAMQEGLIFLLGVCTENLIRVDDMMESPKLAE